MEFFFLLMFNCNSIDLYENRFYKLSQVPMGANKKELLEQLDQVPTYVQQLQFTVKMPTVGKSATFSKVDSVINETKTLMNVISKVVTTCFVCATKVSVFGGKSSKPVNFWVFNFYYIFKRLVSYIVQCIGGFRRKFQYINHCFSRS